MDIPWIMVPCAIIGTWHLTEILRHGSIFEPIRLYADLAPKWFLPVRALQCSFCTSHWAAAACVGLLFAGIVGHIILVWLSVTRMANLLNDVLKRWCRTPGQTSSVNSIALNQATLEDLEREYIKRTGQSLPL